MRTKLLCVLFFLGMASWVFAAGPGEDLFAQAVQKYQAGDYAAAITLNEQVLKDAGVESAAVYFNLGNSYFRAGNLGKSMINYLRAERLAPRDGDIRANLVFARQAVEQYESEKPMASHSRWFGVFSSLASGEFKWLLLFSFMFTGGVWLGCLYAGLPFKRVILWTGLSLALTSYIFVGFSVHFFDALGRAVVLTKTEARFEPSTQATVYFKVPEGEQIKILRHKEGWIKVQRLDGRQAWIPENMAGVI